ncbi:MAG: hypothetical protein AAF694_21420 [Bacteroidota bacterium]
MSKTPHHSYDKIIKENLEAVLLPLSELPLGIQIHKSEKLTGKLQTTLEREPDFIRIVENPVGERFILHLEFQSSDETHMVYRMKEYEAILSRKYRIPIRQFVVYIGEGVSKMNPRIRAEEVFRGFELLNLSSLAAEKLLENDVPEAILKAILGDFKREDYFALFERIFFKIKRLSKSETQLKKYLKQLEVLSRLRNLEEQTTKLIQDMPITYDITKDYVYKKAREEQRIEIVQNWLLSKAFLSGSLKYEDIAGSCGISVERIKEIHGQLGKNKE